jgi:phosphoglycolate phosphatase-like HAD superfamily hydrolase
MSLILFDLDNTLLDTGKVVNQGFKPALQAILGLAEAEFAEANQAYWQSLADSTDFDPQAYAEFLATKYNNQATTLLECIYQPQWYADHVFAEVTNVLTELNADHQLGIFSQGNQTYQTQKLELSGLSQYFPPDMRFIFNRKLDPQILANLPAATVVDDRLAMVLVAQTYPQLKVIWLNRHGENATENVLEIQSLTELKNNI